MTTWLLHTLNGLSMAGLLFLVAAGFTLIFSVMRVVNLAHGALYLLGGYLGLTVLRMTESFLLALIAGGVGVVLVGLLLDRLLRLVQDTPTAQVLLSIGAAIAIGDIILAIWGGLPTRISPPEFMTGRVELFGVLTYPVYRLFLIGIGIVFAVGIWLLLDRTMLGTAVRAGVDDREMVQAQGVHIGFLSGLVFAIGALLAGVAGVFGGGFLTLYPDADWEILVLALVVVVVGGMGHLGGALVGAIIVGLLDSYGRWLMPELAYFLVFAPMAIILTLRPSGLFGRREA